MSDTAVQPFKPIDTSRLENLIGYHLKRAYFASSSAMESELEKLGMALPEFATLTLIASNPGITQSKLNIHLHISRSWCSELVEGLLKKKLIQRDAINLKSFGLHITLSGEKSLKKSWSIVNALDAQLKARLTQREVQQLTKLLEKITIELADENEC